MSQVALLKNTFELGHLQFEVVETKQTALTVDKGTEP